MKKAFLFQKTPFFVFSILETLISSLSPMRHLNLASMKFVSLIGVWIMGVQGFHAQAQEPPLVVYTKTSNGAEITLINHTADSTGSSDWVKVDFSSYGISYSNPIVIASPLTTNDDKPAHIRVRNVTSKSFEYLVEQWKYLTDDEDTDYHGAESVRFMVMNAGTYTIGSRKWQAGKVTGVTSETKRILLNSAFDGSQTLLFQVASYNGTDPVVVRVNNVNKNQVYIELQEEEAQGDHHLAEEVHYIAIKQGNGSDGNFRFKAGKTGDKVSSADHEIKFNSNYYNPFFFAHTRTKNGADTCSVRLKELSSTKAKVFIEEEGSRDNEATHGKEDVSWLIISRQITNNDLFKNTNDHKKNPDKKFAVIIKADDSNKWITVGSDGTLQADKTSYVNASPFLLYTDDNNRIRLEHHDLSQHQVFNKVGLDGGNDNGNGKVCSVGLGLADQYVLNTRSSSRASTAWSLQMKTLTYYDEVHGLQIPYSNTTLEDKYLKASNGHITYSHHHNRASNRFIIYIVGKGAMDDKPANVNALMRQVAKDFTDSSRLGSDLWIKRVFGIKSDIGNNPWDGRINALKNDWKSGGAFTIKPKSVVLLPFGKTKVTNSDFYGSRPLDPSSAIEGAEFDYSQGYHVANGKKVDLSSSSKIFDVEVMGAYKKDSGGTMYLSDALVSDFNIGGETAKNIMIQELSHVADNQIDPKSDASDDGSEGILVSLNWDREYDAWFSSGGLSHFQYDLDDRGDFQYTDSNGKKVTVNNVEFGFWKRFMVAINTFVNDSAKGQFRDFAMGDAGITSSKIDNDKIKAFMKQNAKTKVYKAGKVVISGVAIAALFEASAVALPVLIGEEALAYIGMLENEVAQAIITAAQESAYQEGLAAGAEASTAFALAGAEAAHLIAAQAAAAATSTEATSLVLDATDIATASHSSTIPGGIGIEALKGAAGASEASAEAIEVTAEKLVAEGTDFAGPCELLASLSPSPRSLDLIYALLSSQSSKPLALANSSGSLVSFLTKISSHQIGPFECDARAEDWALETLQSSIYDDFIDQEALADDMVEELDNNNPSNDYVNSAVKCFKNLRDAAKHLVEVIDLQIKILTERRAITTKQLKALNDERAYYEEARKRWRDEASAWE